MLSTRQIHLDFHTSERIPEVGGDFDALAFARTAKEAHVSSMTVFARCHHGWLYYDSKEFPELVHPNLKNKNLLLEEVRALHAQGIKAPVYITVQWDYQMAQAHPEWLIRKRDGSHEGDSFLDAGFYQSLCINTGYEDYLRRMTAEVLTLLGCELDGVFFDIVGVRPCLCAACRRKMRAAGIDANDEVAVRRFAAASMNRFKHDMTKLVRSYSPDCTIFYNAGHVGPCTKESAADYTHFELESLPSGGWGYQHFPVTARYARKLGKDCMGMTGKFHTAWGDFHSLKNQAALEFECFRMLSYGFAISVGDQLHPTGVLNPATYRLIGSVFSQVEQLEKWARPAVPVSEAALVTSEDPEYEHRVPEDVYGAAQMLEELAVQFDIIDPDMDFSGYKLLILPDSLRLMDAQQEKLALYVSAGGHVLSAGGGGTDVSGNYPACFGVTAKGPQEVYPDFIVAAGVLADGLMKDNEYVIYEQGLSAVAKEAQPLLFARAPYFARSGEHFCSHRYTPSAKGEAYPVAFENGSVLSFSHPLFTQYRKNAPLWCKTLVQNALDRLLPERFITHDGPSTLSVQLLYLPEKQCYALHVLSYIPVRKSADMDTIEERTKVRDLTFQIRLPDGGQIRAAKVVPDGTGLSVHDGTFTLPLCDGYAIVELDV